MEGRDRRFPFLGELVECAAKVVARSGNGDLFFVGRSCDSLHDLLKGALAGTSSSDRLHLLPYSHRSESEYAAADLRQLRVNLAALGVTPSALERRDRPIVFTDLVHSGWTFENLYRVLREWIDDEPAAWQVIRTKMRFLGITQQGKTAPNAWRWWQHAPWVKELPRRAVTNVSLDSWVWSYLGDQQSKLAPSFRPPRWADPTVTIPPRDDKTLDALSEAVTLVDQGRSREVRQALARVMAGEPTFREGWLRSLAHELRHG
ncbi:hypothetical protein ACIBG7_24940 [Nonomuraea sp. NPDC050328]|uniref:hypothetical protein n=1 Tax=Nonomuraea sp. NPDC050328 TaxID=3364361 RepID=UPI00378D6B15